MCCISKVYNLNRKFNPLSKHMKTACDRCLGLLTRSYPCVLRFWESMGYDLIFYARNNAAIIKVNLMDGTLPKHCHSVVENMNKHFF